MTRRVRILVEVDVVIHEDWEEELVLDSAADFIGDALERAEDSYEQIADDKGETPYSVDTDDITVWEPTDYLGELMTIRDMSKTARNRLRRFDRLPAADRLLLQVARTERRRMAVSATCPKCSAPVPAQRGVRTRSDGKQSIIVQGSVCPNCGRVEP